MKQFARCTHCRQWYTRHAVTEVDVIRSNSLHGITLWCFRCIQETENRSQMTDASTNLNAQSTVACHARDTLETVAPSKQFNTFIQEHLELMERALHEDDAIIVPIIESFMQRCRSYQNQLDTPDHIERLTRHLHYWEAFLKAMRQSS